MQKYLELDRSDILCHIKDGEIILDNSERCPFLCENGLCRLISELGEDYTSNICREHPRFYHRVGDRVEGGIGLCCEEASRIILTSDDYRGFISADWQGEIADETDFDSITHRNRIYEIIGEGTLPFVDRLAKLGKEYRLCDPHGEDEWNNILAKLDYLYPQNRRLMRIGEPGNVCDEYLERFFAYLVFRHVSIASSYDNLRARLGFCELLVKILWSGENGDIPELARVISEEIEYSVDNTDSLIFEFECDI